MGYSGSLSHISLAEDLINILVQERILHRLQGEYIARDGIRTLLIFW